jgi:hypothetical protein
MAVACAGFPLNALYEGRVDTLRYPLLLVLGPAAAVFQWRLAGEVRRFSVRGWYGAMLELACSMLLKLFVIQDVQALALIEAAWMWYFWLHRDEFGVDLGG